MEVLQPVVNVHRFISDKYHWNYIDYGVSMASVVAILSLACSSVDHVGSDGNPDCAKVVINM